MGIVICDSSKGGETVVDLFAGIGYFSLPYLVHAKAEFIHACEWNPAAVAALRKNLRANKISECRYQVHEGDNRNSVESIPVPRGNIFVLITNMKQSWDL